MQPFAKLPIAELEHIRVLATDIDDTITTAGKIPSATIEGLVALEKAGIVVVLVTGRPAGWAQALASYLAGVRVAIAENGLVSFDSNGLRNDLGPSRGPEFFARLSENGVRVQQAYALCVTPDDAFRLFERAFVRPASFDASALVASQKLVDPDFEVMASSIHIHVRPSGWGKAEGLLAALQPKLLPNEYVLFKAGGEESQTGLARFVPAMNAVLPLARAKKAIFGITPRNLQQIMALDLLLDDDVMMVTLLGTAGTGKTLLALAAGMYKCFQEQAAKYERLLVVMVNPARRNKSMRFEP